jgi:hypothetical protein
MYMYCVDPDVIIVLSLCGKNFLRPKSSELRAPVNFRSRHKDLLQRPKGVKLKILPFITCT